MKFPSKWSALLPLANTVLLLFLSWMAIKDMDRNIKIEQAVTCSYFINVEQYANGEIQQYESLITSESLPQVELEYKKQVQAELVTDCSTGACYLDSCRIVMYKDCLDFYEVSVLKDTTLYY